VLEFARATQKDQGESPMAMEFDLIPFDTKVEDNGEGEKVDVNASSTRTFFCVMVISDQIEQESIDVSIWGSADGENWGAHPLLKLPQRFYRGETRAVLELVLVPEIKFIRARWDLNRWGRVAPLPMFRVGLRLQEVPAMPQVVSPASVSAGS
jgi:hypothetical protein